MLPFLGTVLSGPGRMFSVGLFRRAEDRSRLVVLLANGCFVLVLQVILPLVRGIFLRSLLVLVFLAAAVRLSLGVVLGAADCLKGKGLFAQAEGRFVRGLYRVSWMKLGAEMILAFGIRLNSILRRKKSGKRGDPACLSCKGAK